MTERMEAVDHTHPDASDVLESAFERGADEPPVADGSGEMDAVSMAEVAHTPPHGEGTNGVWSRGDGDAPPVRGPNDDE